jgi:phage terminase large subunit
VVLDEYAQMPSKAWTEVIRPALTDRQGWAVFIGTPKGRNAFYELYAEAKKNSDWYAALYRASETCVLPQAELDMARQQMSPEEYEQEFLCSFQAAILGSYYGTLLAQAETDGRITRVPHEPHERVQTPGTWG